LAPAEGIRLIHSVGGFASWAHPNELDGKDWRAFLPAVLEAGIDGLEAYYSKDYGPEYPGLLLEACTAHDLVPTVGSDFHGFGTLAAPPGSVPSPSDLLERLEARVSRLRATKVR
jgi:predicted metal-dependent phosphoesterase TrpH